MVMDINKWKLRLCTNAIVYADIEIEAEDYEKAKEIALEKYDADMDDFDLSWTYSHRNDRDPEVWIDSTALTPEEYIEELIKTRGY